MIELHVWGPAFSLPSIDAECLATVTYLSQTIPRGQWVLVAINDPSISPTKELPVLRDGATVVAGYQSIVSHLRATFPKYDLNASLSPLQKADSIAFSSLISSTFSPLLSLAHYVSSENYNTTTRPALCALLPSIPQYILPSQIRAAAKVRTKHLELSALDVDTAIEEQNRDDAIPGSEQIPRSLRTVRQSVASIVRQPQHAVQFRLDALTEAALQPLSELLGDKNLFLTEKGMTSLDCLALGYLSLALLSKMPQPWLAEAMKKKYPNLCKFVNKGIDHCFRGPVTLEDARLPPDPNLVLGPDHESNWDLPLPWIPPPSPTLISTSQFLLTHTLSSLPLISTLHQDKILPSSNNNSNDMGASSTIPPFLLPTLLGLGAAAAAAAAGAYLLSSTSENEKRERKDMGEVGQMLAGLDFGPAASL